MTSFILNAIPLPPCALGRPLTVTKPTNNRRRLRLHASILDYPLASRIVIRNLPHSTSESCLREEFSAFGDIAEVKLPRDEVTKMSRGYAFIQYTSQDDAISALEEMDCQKFEGRVIHVEIARPTKGMFGGYPRTSGPHTGHDLATHCTEKD